MSVSPAMASMRRTKQELQLPRMPLKRCWNCCSIGRVRILSRFTCSFFSTFWPAVALLYECTLGRSHNQPYTAILTASTTVPNIS